MHHTSDTHLSPLVKKVNDLLIRAEVACSTIKSGSIPGHNSQTLAQLQQAFQDERTLIQVQYDNIKHHYLHDDSTQGKGTSQGHSICICELLSGMVRQYLYDSRLD